MGDSGRNAGQEKNNEKRGEGETPLEVELRRAAKGEGLRLREKIGHGCSMNMRIAPHAVASSLIIGWTRPRKVPRFSRLPAARADWPESDRGRSRDAGRPGPQKRRSRTPSPCEAHSLPAAADAPAKPCYSRASSR